MPVAGDIVTRTYARSGVQSLRALGDSYLAQATAAAAAPQRMASLHRGEHAVADFPLRAVSKSLLDRVGADISKSMVWVNDMLCAQRAILGAAELQRAAGAGGQMIAPADDAFVAAIVTARSPSVFKAGWGFHSSLLVRVEGENGLQVVDYMLFDRPVSLTRWCQAVGIRSKDVVVTSPFMYTGQGGKGSNPALPLLDRWDLIPEGYRIRGDLRLDPTGSDTVLQLIRAQKAA